MANQSLGLGTEANDGTGDTLRVASDKINDNFLEIYTLIGDESSLTTGISATASVVTLTAPTITGVVGGTQTSATITTLTGTTLNAGTLAIAAGSITDSSGAISFGNENLTTTGTITGALATAAQTAITSVGTLTALQVDNININGNAITSTAGTDLTISPVSGQQIVLDGTIVVDAGVVTGATSITSTAFVGGLTGAVTGNADTATLASTSTITANNTGQETIFPVFVDGATGTQGLETDTGFTYNPNSGMLTAAGFTGALTGNATTATNLAASNNISITGDVTANAISFNGASGNTVALSTSLSSNAVVTASITNLNVTTGKLAADAVTNAKIADDAVDTENIADDAITSALIDNGAVIAAAIGTNAVETAKINASAVTTAKIAADAVTAAKIVDNAIGQEHLQDDVVSGAEMKDLRTFTLKDSSGSALFIMYGAGDLT